MEKKQAYKMKILSDVTVEELGSGIDRPTSILDQRTENKYNKQDTEKFLRLKLN